MAGFLSTLGKILVASLIIGAVLSVANINAWQLLGRVGVTQDKLVGFFADAVNWVLPNMLLTVLIIVPVWLLFYMINPPKK